jgi:adenylate cyclase class 1
MPSVIDIFDRQSRIFELFNQRRIEYLRSSLPEKKRQVFDCVPFLLHESDQRLPGSHVQAPAGITCYTPDTATKALVREFFPFFSFANKAKNRLSISFVALMGSAGTVAFTEDSDLDFWIGLDKCDSVMTALMKEKFRAIEQWAEKTAGLELHFFIADPAKIRMNDFGELNDESCGSAQGRLLKDEFYRTAIFLHGKKPFYWIVPPGTNDALYANNLAIARSHPGFSFDNYLDLGNVSTISKSEFYGAALWHLLKCVRSPFKSVLKMALIDEYAADAGPRPPLCERYKNLVFGATTTTMADPYLYMMEELRSFYATQNLLSISQLLEECFLIRNLCITGRKTVDKARMEYFVHLGTRWNWKRQDVENLARFRQWDTFTRQNLHSRIIGYLLQAYQRIKSSTSDIQASISDRDLTIVGRRLAGYFAQKPGKVPYDFSLLGPKDISAIEIRERREPGRQPCWQVRLRIGNQANPEYHQLNDIPDPLVACAWCSLNGFFNGRQEFRIQGTSPLSVKDAVHLIASMDRFFPHREAESLTIGDLLNRERITHAYIVPGGNPASRSTRLEGLYVFYRNTAGERLYAYAPGEECVTWLSKEFLLITVGTDNIGELTWTVHSSREAIASPRTVGALITKAVEDCIGTARLQRRKNSAG